MFPPYEATFSVPIHCDSCVNDISAALSRVKGNATGNIYLYIRAHGLTLGIGETSFSLSSHLVTTKGTAAPSTIISTIQSTGRTAILRGSGAANSAAVCILETPPPQSIPSKPESSPVRGLARLIELSARATLLDMTLTGLPKGTYVASLRQTGDISRGSQSLGDVFNGLDSQKDGNLGKLEVDEHGRGALIEEVDWRIWEMVGRGMLVKRCVQDDPRLHLTTNGTAQKEAQDHVVMGVVARSAGVWENEKVVCGCSGKTVWEEREEQVSRGMS